MNSSLSSKAGTCVVPTISNPGNSPACCPAVNTCTGGGQTVCCDSPCVNNLCPALTPSCKDLHAAQPALGDGVYAIDPDGAGPNQPFNVYCNMTLDGGGWQLISVRHADSGVLFGNALCTGTGQSCSGTIPASQRVSGVAPELLFATVDSVHWLRVGGLAASGAGALLDVITLQRALTDAGCSSGSNYCLALGAPDPNLQVQASSPNFTPRSTSLSAQYAANGGLCFGNGGCGLGQHVASMNYLTYCGGGGGLDLSSTGNNNVGSARCSAPGALYFRY